MGDTVFPCFVYLMSRRGISIPPRVCGSGGRGIPPGSVGESRWFSACAPCLANWGGGGCRGLVRCLVVGCYVCGEGCRGLVCCLMAGCFVCLLTLRDGEAAPSGSALRVSARTLSAAKQGRVERPGDGCPCVGAEEVCSEPPQDEQKENCRGLARCLQVSLVYTAPQASNVADSRHAKARHRHTTVAGNHFKKS